MTNTIKWVQLKERNNWGHIFYTLPEEYSKVFVLTEGTEFLVRWPDGTITREKLISRNQTGDIGDMGHVYHYSTNKFGFIARIHGISQFISITDVEIEV